MLEDLQLVALSFHSSSDLAARQLCVAPLSTKAVVELLAAHTLMSQSFMVRTCGFVFSGEDSPNLSA